MVADPREDIPRPRRFELRQPRRRDGNILRVLQVRQFKLVQFIAQSQVEWRGQGNDIRHLDLKLFDEEVKDELRDRLFDLEAHNRAELTA